jgi:hypothetical protein
MTADRERRLVMRVVGFDRIRQLKQFFSAASGDANDRSSLNFI